MNTVRDELLMERANCYTALAFSNSLKLTEQDKLNKQQRIDEITDQLNSMTEKELNSPSEMTRLWEEFHEWRRAQGK